MSRVPADQRREQLIEATIQLAVRKGLAEASVRNIAEEANVSLGVVHYCFNSKEALLKAVAESFVTPIIGPVSEAISAAEPGELVDALETALQVFADVMMADRGRQLLGYELVAWSIRGEGDAAKSLHRAYLEVIDKYLKEGIGLKDGDLRFSLDDAPRMILAWLDGVMLGWLVDGDDERCRRMLRDFASILVTPTPTTA
ncbi:MAG: TetR/AcrR family transcriptional regulator [Austwickia sp.]|jgi:AcrR family transcriptional regulator|nr:TetR/AcrR family transcriptional regulator [Austwickia sp.]